MLARRIAAVFGRARADRDLDDEIQAHLDLLAADYERQGMKPADARLAARRAFGGVEPMKEAYRGQHRAAWIEDACRDVRYAWGGLRRGPGFTCAVVATMALAVGAGTAVFSVVDSIFLQALPVSRPEQLAILGIEHTAGRLSPDFSYRVYQQLRQRADAFSSIAATNGISTARMTLTDGGTSGAPEIVQAERVSGNFFTTLGVDAALGTTLTGIDDDPGTVRPVVVLGHEFWSRRFGRDPAVVGRRIAINDVTFTILGVAPAGFFGIDVSRRPDLWYPLQMFPRVFPGRSADALGLRVVGRLRPRAEVLALAQADVVFQQDLAEQRRTAAPGRVRTRRWLALDPGITGLSRARRELYRPLLVLAACVGLILVMAAVNVATLLVARAAARRKELAVRRALGAGRTRLIRQLLTEGLVLAVVSGTAGLMLSVWATPLLVDSLLGPQSGVAARVDLRVIVFALLISAVAGLFFGVLSGSNGIRAEVGQALKQGESTRGAYRVRFGGGLVVTQVALSLVLLTGTGLLARTVRNLERVDTGFDQQEVVVFRLDLPIEYDADRRGALYRNVLGRLEALPGVAASSFSAFGMLSADNFNQPIRVPGYRAPPSADMNVREVLVGPRFFETVGMSVVAGRAAGSEDGGSAPRVAVVNRAMARRFFGSGPTLGRRFSVAQWGDEPFEIVGVAEDARYRSLREEPPPTAYVPFYQVHGRGSGNPLSVQFEVRTTGAGLAIEQEIRRAVADVDPRAAVLEVRQLQEVVAATFRQERLLARAGTFFSAFALVLASIGVYGLRSYVVAGRRTEIGLRLGLGAPRSTVFWTIVRDSLILVAAGMAIGLPVVLAAASGLRALLFGIEPVDPVTIAGAVLTLALAGGLAGCVPAWRAMRVDPIVALRSE